MLYNKYRPSSLDDLVGQNKVKTILGNIFKKPIEEVPRVYMLQGSTGTGKTTTAHIIKNYFGVHDDSFIEMNGADNNGVDDMRSLVEGFHLKPLQGEYTMIFIDECHRLTTQAWNQLLKPLEDTPKHVVVLLGTSEPESIKVKAIKQGRYQELDFVKLNEKQLLGIIKNICKKEEKMIAKETAYAIVSRADGSARFAITLLESVIDVEDKEKAIEIINSSNEVESSGDLKDLFNALIHGEDWYVVSNALKKVNLKPEDVRYKVLAYVSSCLLNCPDNLEWDRLGNIIGLFENSFEHSGKAGLINACYDCCS